MKKIGILGGVDWRSTAVYYRILNEEVRRRLGGKHSAHLLLESFNFADVSAPRTEVDWQRVRGILRTAAQRLESAGADFWLMACNTLHRDADKLESAVGIPLLHIADVAGKALRARGIERVALLGTQHTMQGTFYAERLASAHGVETMVPNHADQARIDHLIFEQLCRGTAPAEGRVFMDRVGSELCARGAQATLLACTELRLLYRDEELHGRVGRAKDAPPVFDTTALHALAAADLALSLSDAGTSADPPALLPAAQHISNVNS